MRILAFLLATLLMGSVAHAKPGPGDWYFGFGLGSGTASMTFDTANGEQRQDYDEFFKLPTGEEVDSLRLSLSLEGGVRLAPRYLAGLHLASIAQSGETRGTTLTVGHTQVLGVLTYFPNRKGLFVRGGLGGATTSVTVDIPEYSLRSRYEEKGTGIMLGGGFAFPISRSARFTLTFDLHAAAFDGDPGAPTSASFGTMQLGVTWF